MKSDHPHAANLFHRLFSYSPRPARSPLEDFCTEALAWCLLQPSNFQCELLDEIRGRLDANGKLKPRLKAYAGKLTVPTQLSYRGEPMEEKDEATVGSAGRFDLVLRSVPDTEFVIVIESKVGTDPGLNDQVGGYKAALQIPEWKTVSERYVVTLTRSSNGPPNADAHLSWDKVHGLLIKAAKRENEPAAHRSTFKQFGDFLENRGLNLVKLMRLTTQQIQSFTESAPFFDQAHKFFECFENNESLKALFNTKQSRIPRVETYKGDGWYGIFSQDWRNYAGFYFRDGKMGLCLEVNVHGDLLKNAKGFSAEAQAAIENSKLLFKTPPKYDGGRTTFRFSRARKDEEETDDMIAWFAMCAAEVKRGDLSTK